MERIPKLELSALNLLGLCFAAERGLDGMDAPDGLSVPEWWC